MIAIRQEIAEVEAGKVKAEDSVLRHAPHTHHLLMGEWDRPYSKEHAFFPLNGAQTDKYWPPVGRVDNVAGARNLACTCPPTEAYRPAVEKGTVSRRTVLAPASPRSNRHPRPCTTAPAQALGNGTW